MAFRLLRKDGFKKSSNTPNPTFMSRTRPAREVFDNIRRRHSTPR
jgi:hypothetical protein